jgi:hypothetical protein
LSKELKPPHLHFIREKIIYFSGMILRFEKVGDINTTYPYIEVFLANEKTPFMDIGINDSKQLEFFLYPPTEIKLSLMQLEEIIDRAKIFYPKALKDEEDSQDLA